VFHSSFTLTRRMCFNFLQLLRQVKEFHDSHGNHIASLTAVADMAHKKLEAELTRARYTVNDAEMFETLVRSETRQVLSDEMPFFLDKSRLNLFIQSNENRAEVYSEVWTAIQPIFDITESISERMQRRRLVAVQRD
jgi:hypothetical protein